MSAYNGDEARDHAPAHTSAFEEQEHANSSSSNALADEQREAPGDDGNEDTDEFKSLSDPHHKQRRQATILQSISRRTLYPMYEWIAIRVAVALGEVTPVEVEEAMTDDSNWRIIEQYVKGQISTIFASKEVIGRNDSVRRKPRRPRRNTELKVEFFFNKVSQRVRQDFVYLTRMQHTGDANEDYRPFWEEAGREGLLRNDDIIGQNRTSSDYPPLKHLLHLYDDSHTTVGTLSPDIISALTAMYRLVYYPIFGSISKWQWGQCHLETVNQFRRRLHEYIQFLEDTSSSIIEDKQLARPQPQTVQSLEVGNGDLTVEQVEELCSLVNEWCDHADVCITNAGERIQGLGNTEAPRLITEHIPTLAKKISLDGPDSELDFWRRRLRRLNSLHEQLRQSEKRHVIKELKRVWSTGAHLDGFPIEDTLKRWAALESTLSQATNTAKENVKYMSILSKYVQPLSTRNIRATKEAVRSLISSLVMVYCMSRQFGSSERMTKLLQRVSNELIVCCLKAILGQSPSTPLWERDTPDLVQIMEECVNLNEGYQQEIQQQCEMLHEDSNKPDLVINGSTAFGRLDLFVRRLIKLIDLFTTIDQFRSFREKNVEGLDELFSAYDGHVEWIRNRGHPLLDFLDDSFDRDYERFSVKIAEMETSLRYYLNKRLGELDTLNKKMCLITKFEPFVQRPQLRQEIYDKVKLFFREFGLLLLDIQDTYDANKDNPPTPRDTPPVTGRILWSRQLFRLIEGPMKYFEKYLDILDEPEMKNIIKAYNTSAKTLVAYENVWISEWQDHATKVQKLLGGPILAHDNEHSGISGMYVNFPTELTQLLIETKQLLGLGIEIPSSLRLLSYQEEHMKRACDDLHSLLYTARSIEVSLRHFHFSDTIHKVFRPLLLELQRVMEPGLNSLSWRSLNVDTFVAEVGSYVSTLKTTMDKCDDILRNRVDRNLLVVYRTTHYKRLYEGHSSLHELWMKLSQDLHHSKVALIQKSIEIETALDDMLEELSRLAIENLSNICQCYSTDDSRAALRLYATDVAEVKVAYHERLYLAVRYSVLSSFDQIRSRAVVWNNETRDMPCQAPLFSAHLTLNDDNIKISPTLDETQRTVKHLGRRLLHGMREIPAWNTQSDMRKGNPCKPARLLFDHLVDHARAGQSINADPMDNADPSSYRMDLHVEDSPMKETVVHRKALVDSYFELPDIPEFVNADHDDGRWSETDIGTLEDQCTMNAVFLQLSQDKRVIRMILLLTGLFYGSSRRIREVEAALLHFQWLWAKNRREELRQQLKQRDDKSSSISGSITEDYAKSEMNAALDNLKQLEQTETEIQELPLTTDVGAVRVHYDRLKQELYGELWEWKLVYAEFVRFLTESRVSSISIFIKSSFSVLNLEIFSLPILARVCSSIRTIQLQESDFHGMISPTTTALDKLQNTMGPDYELTEEYDTVNDLKHQWSKLVNRMKEVSHHLFANEGLYLAMFSKEQEKTDREWKLLAQEIEAYKPFATGDTDSCEISPHLTEECRNQLGKLNSKLEALEQRERNLKTASELFGFDRQISQTVEVAINHLRLWNDVWSFSSKVETTLNDFDKMQWRKAVHQLKRMKDRTNVILQESQRFSSTAAELSVFLAAINRLRLYEKALSVLEELNVDYLQDRHWSRIGQILDIVLPYEEDLDFPVSTLISGKLITAKPDIDDVLITAEKEHGIEKKLTSMEHFWEDFSITTEQSTEYDLPLVAKASSTIEQLDEAILALQAFSRMKHAMPFEARIQELLSSLSAASDTYQLWLRVQSLWLNLAPVFLSGEITTQLPMEAKRFSKLDKQWRGIMGHVRYETKLLTLCLDEATQQSLNTMVTGLHKCQGSLQRYLERKREQFPRFYLLSDASLLQILSRGNNVAAIMNPLGEIFPGISLLKDRMSGGEQQAYSIVHQLGDEQEELELLEPIAITKSPENWMANLETAMQTLMKNVFQSAAEAIMTQSLSDVVQQFPSQACILAVKILWTAETAKAIETSYRSKNNFSPFAKTQLNMLNMLSRWCAEVDIQPMVRQKIEALIITVLHHRDMFQEVVRAQREGQLHSTKDFEWLRHMRAYWFAPPSEGENAEKNTFGYSNVAHFWGGVRDSAVLTSSGQSIDVFDKDYLGDGRLEIKICDISLVSSYEYLGVTPRLVVTPLTDRAFIAMLYALRWNYGGSPTGPAGTGKTETVKDLGRMLATPVNVINCSSTMLHEDLSRIFKGVAATRTWLCLDEFNRLTADTLSGASTLIDTIAVARKGRLHAAEFPDCTLTFPPESVCGYFITMNPGYAGRQNLPDSVKRHFRTFAMMKPDEEVILRIKLCSQGFQNFSQLSRKCCKLFRLASSRLSSLRHYDFGLRGLLSILPLSLRYKATSSCTEAGVVCKAVFSVNLARLDRTDTSLFLELAEGIFGNDDVVAALRELASSSNSVHWACKKLALLCTQQWQENMQQLSSVASSRHGILVLGDRRVGKSMTIYALGMKTAADQEDSIRVWSLNPKALSTIDMFGYLNTQSKEWIDGVFSVALERYTAPDSLPTWFLLDGPVDSDWIENLNSLLDDNRTLVLSNGQRLGIRSDTKVFFETYSVGNASPATVSRVGIFYLQHEPFEGEVLASSWCSRCSVKSLSDEVYKLYKRYISGNEESRTNTLTFLQSKFIPSNAIHDIRERKTSLMSAMMRNVLCYEGTFNELRFVELVFQLFTSQMEAHRLGSGTDDTIIPTTENSESKSPGIVSNSSHRRFLPNSFVATDRLDWSDSGSKMLLDHLFAYSVAMVMDSFLKTKYMSVFYEWMQALDAPLRDSGDTIRSYLSVEYGPKPRTVSRSSSPGPSTKPLLQCLSFSWKSYSGLLEQWSRALEDNLHQSLNEQLDPHKADPRMFLMPTEEGIRISYLRDALSALRLPLIVQGGRGVGKSALLRSLARNPPNLIYEHPLEGMSVGLPQTLRYGLASDKLDKENLHSTMSNIMEITDVNSASHSGTHIVVDRGLSVSNFRQQLHADLVRKGGRTYGPEQEKTTLFIEDLHMSEVDSWGDSPLVELTKQLLETDSLPFMNYDNRGDTLCYDKLNVIASGSMTPASSSSFLFPVIMRQPTDSDIMQVFSSCFFISDLPQSYASFMSEQLTTNCIVPLCSVQTETSAPLLPLHKMVVSVLQLLYNMDEGERKSPALIFQRFFDEILNQSRNPSVSSTLTKGMRTTVDSFAGAFGTKEPEFATNAFGSLSRQLDYCYYYVTTERVSETSQELSSSTDMMWNTLFSNIVNVQNAPRHIRLWLKENNHSESVKNFLLRRWNAILQESSESTGELSVQQVFMVPYLMERVTEIFRALQTPAAVLILGGSPNTGKSTALSIACSALGSSLRTIDSSASLTQFLDELRDAISLSGGISDRKVVFAVYIKSVLQVRMLNALDSLIRADELRFLFSRDEILALVSDISELDQVDADIEDEFSQVVKYVVRKVRKNFSLVLLPSSNRTGYSLEHLQDDFPAMTGVAQMIYFSPWPERSFSKIAYKSLQQSNVLRALHVQEHNEAQVLSKLSRCFSATHECANEITVSDAPGQTFQANSYSWFLTTFQKVVARKTEEAQTRIKELSNGLNKINNATDDIRRLRSEVKEQQALVERKDHDCNILVEQLNEKAIEARQEKQRVEEIRRSCEEQRGSIEEERKVAEADLKEAQPYLEQALKAVENIHSSDIIELKGMSNPQPIVKLVFDCVLILLTRPVHTVEPSRVKMGSRRSRIDVNFLKDSYDYAWKYLLLDLNLMSLLKSFARDYKDNIAEETVELVEPYLNLPGMTDDQASYSSKAVAGLLNWVRALIQYHKTSKVVKPRLRALEDAKARLFDAEASLRKAQQQEDECNNKLEELQNKYQSTLHEQRELVERAYTLRSKLSYASTLIEQLSGEKQRWERQLSEQNGEMDAILGDCFLASTVLSYTGQMDFSQQRTLLYQTIKLLENNSVDISLGLYLPSGTTNIFEDGRLSTGIFSFVERFICSDKSSIGKLQSDGVRENRKFLQNAAVVSSNLENRCQSLLLIDPQDTCLFWLRRLGERLQPNGQVMEIHGTSMNFGESFERGLERGSLMLVQNPSLENFRTIRPFLKGTLVARGTKNFVRLRGNAHESEVSAHAGVVTIFNAFIDEIPQDARHTCICVQFTMDMEALEEQILSLVSHHEQQTLEEQLRQKTEEVLSSERQLQELEERMLQHLSTQEGNMLEDDTLMRVLSDVKRNVERTQENLESASNARSQIRGKREVYRLVACHSKALYMSIESASALSIYYVMSINRFLEVFQMALERAPSSPFTPRRLTNILEAVTAKICTTFSGQLFSEHRKPFYTFVAISLLREQGAIGANEIRWLNSSLNYDRSIMSEEFTWLPRDILINIKQIASELPVFRDLHERIIAHEKQWKQWYTSLHPETSDIEQILKLLSRSGSAAPFHRLLLTKLFFPGRLSDAIDRFLHEAESTSLKPNLQSYASVDKIPVVGRAVETWDCSVMQGLVNALEETSNRDPVLVVHQSGIDVSGYIDKCAKEQEGPSVTILSVGSAPKEYILNVIGRHSAMGGWVLVENLHIFPELLWRVNGFLSERGSGEVSPNFRVFFGSLPVELQDTAILRECRIVVAANRAGIKNRMLYFLRELGSEAVDRINVPFWIPLLYSLCYLHANSLERANWGGWFSSVDLNDQDLHCAVQLAESCSDGPRIDWKALRCMLRDIIYGGKLTDSFDFSIMRAMVERWFPVSESGYSFLLTADPEFRSCYSPPKEGTYYSLQDLIDHTEVLPSSDVPAAFGWSEGSLVYLRNLRSIRLQDYVRRISNCRLYSSVHEEGDRRQHARRFIEQLLKKLPAQTSWTFVEDNISRQGGGKRPLNTFLRYEIQAMNSLLSVVSSHLQQLQEILLLADNVALRQDKDIRALQQEYVPQRWVWDDNGNCISWTSPTDITGWMRLLNLRHDQLLNWITRGRPKSYWLPGFFDKRSFLIAVQQETLYEWNQTSLSLDDVTCEVKPHSARSYEEVQKRPKAGDGVLIHGLYLKGAKWNQKIYSLEELGRQTVSRMPVIQYSITQSTNAKSQRSYYACPLYEYEEKGDSSLIDTFSLPTQLSDPSKWVLSGTALFCAVGGSDLGLEE